MTESNTPHLRAKLPVDSLDGFFETFGQFILPGRMFLPTAPSRLKSVGDSIQFEVLLSDGSRALAGKGIVRQVRSESEATRGPAGMVVEYTHLSKRSKALVKDILRQKKAERTDDPEATSESPDASDSPPESRPPEADEPKSSLEETTERADPREEADVDAGPAPEGTDPEIARPETDDKAADQDEHEPSETDGEATSDDSQTADDETLDEMAQTGFDVGDDSEVSVRDPEARDPEADDEQEDAGGEFDELGVSAGAEAALLGDDESDDDPSEETEAKEAEDNQTKKSGLQVLPYDDEPDSPEDALSELDFGEDSDVDRMLDNMFSGGSDESELDEDEATDALFAEAFDDESASERRHQEPDEPTPERKHQEPGPDNQPDAEVPDSEAVEAQDAEDATTADELSALAAEAGPDSTTGQEDPTDLAAESTERTDVDPESEGLEPLDDTENNSGELDEAFRALDQNDEEHPKRRDLKLSIDEEDAPEEVPDDDSLDALIADTQQELEPVSSESEDDEEKGDALDKVLGDDLPEPPSDEFEFDPGQDFRPSGARKNPADDADEDGANAESSPEREPSDEDSSKKDEKKGFLSRFFGGGDD